MESSSSVGSSVAGDAPSSDTGKSCTTASERLESDAAPTKSRPRNIVKSKAPKRPVAPSPTERGPAPAAAERADAPVSLPKASEAAAGEDEDEEVGECPGSSAEEEASDPEIEDEEGAGDGAEEKKKEEAKDKLDKECRDLRIKILAYHAKFPKVLGKTSIARLEGLSRRKLNRKLENCRFCVSSQNGEAMLRAAYFGGASLGEALLHNSTYPVDGVALMLQKSPEIDQILTEIGIEYSEFMHVDPVYRLAAGTLVAFTAANKLAMQARRGQATVVPAAVAAKYQDL
jgi:hypothetical protein